jgi:phage tail-like protein
MASWRGRGKGRAGAQPQLTFQSGPGKGSGRPGAQPQIQPAIVDGKEMTTWVGRGGGRSPSQPRIQSASVIAAQRGIQQAASNIISGAVGAVGGALGGFMGQPALARSLEDPIGGYVFALEINKMEVAHFTECAGLKSNTEVYTIKEGGMNHAVHKLPGQSTWDNIVLKYGVTSDMSMLGLREFIMNDEYAGGSDSVDLGDVMNAGSTNTSAGSLINSLSNTIRTVLDGGAGTPGKMENKRFSGSIVLKNNKMQEMVRYTFQQAWVVSWEGPKLNSEGSNLAIETIEIAHHGINVSRSYATKNPFG